MKPPKQFSNSSPEGNSESDFEEELQEVERSLLSLQERYTQVQSDREKKAQWQQRRQELQQNKNPTPEIKAELRQIKQQLEVLELNLESQLFSWRSFKKPFWQAVRFGGMGVIIGWILKSCAG
jgi:seryl-tRNA synthetase